jgi:protein-S-isoprenylcysteine O-methyltransferase Ste14
MSTARTSPWWYRQRPLVFAAMYVAGFASTIRSRDDVEPAFLWLGLRAGPLGPTILLGIAALLALAAWALRTWGASYLTAAVVWSPNARDDRLIVDGPFRYVRNPLYLGSLLLAVALGSFATPLGFAILVAGNVLFTLALISVEAPMLRARYGAAFDAYRGAVPSLVPRLRAADVPGTARVAPSLAQGLRSEVFTALLVVGTLALCIGRSAGVPVFYAFLAAAALYRIAITLRTRSD